MNFSLNNYKNIILLFLLSSLWALHFSLVKIVDADNNPLSILVSLLAILSFIFCKSLGMAVNSVLRAHCLILGGVQKSTQKCNLAKKWKTLSFYPFTCDDGVLVQGCIGLSIKHD